MSLSALEITSEHHAEDMNEDYTGQYIEPVELW